MPYIDGQITGYINKTSQNISYDRVGTVPTPEELIITVTSGGNVSYVEFYIQFENSSIAWLSDLSDQMSGFLTFDGINSNLPLKLNNLDNLTAGNYKAKIFFTLSNPTDPNLVLTSEVNLNLTGNAPDALRTDKSNYNVVYQRSSNTFSGETAISLVNNTAADNITFETIGSLFLEGTSTTGFTLQEDPAHPFATNSELPTSGTQLVSCRLKKDGQYIYAFTVTIAVINTDDIVATPNSIDFQLRNGFNETQSTVISIINPLNRNFTITAPDWLNLSSSSGNSTTQITVTTDNSDTLTSGDHSGNIVISYNSKTITIPVTLTVKSFFSINYSALNFCLDGIKASVNRMFDTGRFARITLSMKFENNEGVKEVSSAYSIPFYDDMATFDIGEIIHNFFPEFKKSLFESSNIAFNNQLICKPAIVGIIIDELDVNYELLKSATVENLKFLAGKTPLQFPIFSDFNLRRFFNNWKHIFSYYTADVEPIDFTTSNLQSNAVTNNEVNAVILEKNQIDFDKIKNNFGIDFLQITEPNKSILVQFINENKVPEGIVFSGDYRILTDIEQIYDNIHINAEKYDAKEISRLIIGTGFLLKEERNFIKNLCKSNLIYMQIENEIFKCFSIQKNLETLNSASVLNNFELEFFIVKDGN